jgi:glycosyltransferase involved in cell wall biosynthesis
VYNIGDHAPYHGQLVALSREAPGVLVVHDLSLSNLMLGELLAMPPSTRAWQLRRWYGDAAEEAAEGILADPAHWATEDDNPLKFPLIEFAVADALGVVTHSEYSAANLRPRYAGDVWRLPLPALHFGDAEVDEVELPMLDDRQVILQAGVLNPNKCVPAVIDGFEAAHIADRAQLVICGFAERPALARLNKDVKARGLTDSVHVLGPVSDATLHSLRRRASIATVLRDPCIEAASAVLLDSMAYGLAVVTVNSGHYVEVPADCVARVPVPPKAVDLAAIFRTWVDDPALAAEIGARATAYVDAEHTPQVYADRMADVLRLAGSYPRRRALAIDLAATLDRLGFAPDDEITEVVADTATELFGGEPRRARELL